MVTPRLAAAIACLGGCTSLLGIDGDYVERRPGSAGGSQGTGAAGASNGGAGAASGGGASGAAAGGSGPGGSPPDAGSAGAPVDGTPDQVADQKTDGGASGVSGASGSSGSGGCAPLGNGCPTSLPGPPLVEVGVPNRSGSYCIDATEVTNEAYALFLGSNPNPITQPPPCTGVNFVFVPESWPPGSGEGALPVTGIDWCDASEYCRWAGKRLCGRIGGATAPLSGFADPNMSQWFNACSAAGARTYPYGDVFDPLLCNGATDAGPGRKAIAADFPGCIGGCGAIHNLSGNVSEWEDSCFFGAGVVDCRVRGGSYESDPDGLACAADERHSYLDRSPSRGFRCCT